MIRTLFLVLSFSGGFALGQQLITTGPPVMVAPAGAREGGAWNPKTQTLYVVSGPNVNRFRPGDQDPKIEAFRTDAPGQTERWWTVRAG